MGTSIVGAKSYFLSAENAGPWHSVLRNFQALGINDLYFTPEYGCLYASANSVEAFVYEESEKVFFIPYIKSAISLKLVVEQSYTLETPYGYSGPLSNCEDEKFLKRAWDEFFLSCRKNNIIAGFVRFHSLLENHRLAERAEIKEISFSNTVVTLTLDKTQEQVVADYSDNTRNNISKAKRDGVQITCSQKEEDLKIFRKLYHSTMDQVKAAAHYYFSDDYFQKIHECFPQFYRVYLAKLNDVYIGGVLIFLSQDYVYLHLSANLKEYRHAEPASLLRHEAIVSNLNCGRKAFIFGGGNSADPQDPLFKFKKSFSKETAPFYVGKMIFDQSAYDHVCQRWELMYPEKIDKYKNYFLKFKN